MYYCDARHGARGICGGGELTGNEAETIRIGRDLSHLVGLKAIVAEPKVDHTVLSIRLEWATEVTDTSFYEDLRRLPEAKTHLILGPNFK